MYTNMYIHKKACSLKLVLKNKLFNRIIIKVKANDFETKIKQT